MKGGGRQGLALLTGLWCALAMYGSGCSSPTSPGTSPAISTVAGTGIAGDNGDGLSGPETSLYLPQDIAFGPDGHLYIADWNNHRIRRVANGVVETVAGTGELGDALDGRAVEAKFNHPTNLTFDHEGRMIIAAWHNSKVKRVDLTTGFIENLAGTGSRSYGGDGGQGNEAVLDLPSSVVVDAVGNIIISDQANQRIRLLEPNGTITTICGNGKQGYSGDGGVAEDAQLNSPFGQVASPAGRIALDLEDRIYIADTGNHVIRVIDNDRRIRTIAGTGRRGYSGDGGPAIDAELNMPSDVVVADDGTIYIADTKNHAIRRIGTGGIITTFAGTGERGFSGDGGAADAALLDRPYGVTISPEGELYIADTHNHRVRRVTADLGSIAGGNAVEPREVKITPCTGEAGSICTYVGTGASGFNGDGHHRLQTDLYWPWDIEFTPAGRRIVLDWNNHAVREILPDETLDTIVGTYFVGDGPDDLSDLTEPGADPLTVNLNHPTDVQEFPNGDVMLMAWHNHKIRSIDAESGRVLVVVGAEADYAGDGGPAREALINQPPHGVLDPDGNLIFIDQRNQRIRVIYNFAEQRGDGIITTIVGTGEKGFNGDGEGLGTMVAFPAGGNPEPSGSLALSDAGELYFADTDNHRIRKITFVDADLTMNTVTTVAGSGDGGFSGDGGPAASAQINFPQDMEIGPDGNLYFADTDNHRIRRIDLATGTIITVAGTGAKGYGGDGGPALDALLNRPFGIGFDDAGLLYVSDTFNGRIRMVVVEKN